MPALDLNFSDSQSIGSDQEEFPPIPKKRRNLAYPAKNKGYCNCRICKTCHIVSQNYQRKKQIKLEKEPKLNKNPRLKKCTKECTYCQKIIERKSYKIYQNKTTSQIQENQIPNIINHINNS